MAPSETVILLVEDEALVRNLVQLMLTKEGYAVLSAKDGQEALELSEAFKDPIHLLLTDVRMPRLDGITLKELVRAKRPDIRVIVMSGETANTISVENTPDAFLRKPFIPPTLLKCVQRVLEEGFSGVCQEVET
jgi:two-component system cell cycle sensor histidine kinase/response regulator CckA